MQVIDYTGWHTVNVNYCGCGRYANDATGDWEQVLASGWHRAGLIHNRVCATFKVLDPAIEADYPADKVEVAVADIQRQWSEDDGDHVLTASIQT